MDFLAAVLQLRSVASNGTESYLHEGKSAESPWKSSVMRLHPIVVSGGHIRKLLVPHVSKPGQKADAQTV